LLFHSLDFGLRGRGISNLTSPVTSCQQQHKCCGQKE
jgi:hypothetical protein